MSAKEIAQLIAERLLTMECGKDDERLKWGGIVPFHETANLMYSLQDSRKKNIAVLQKIPKSPVKEIFEAFNMLGPEHTFKFALELAASEELLFSENFLKACVLFAHQGGGKFDSEMAETIVIHKGEDPYVERIFTHLYPVFARARDFKFMKEIFPEFDRVKRAGYNLNKKNIHAEMIDIYENRMIQRLGAERYDPSLVIPDRGDSFALSSNCDRRIWEAVQNPEKLFPLLDYVFEAWEVLEKQPLEDRGLWDFKRRKRILALFWILL